LSFTSTWPPLLRLTEASEERPGATNVQIVTGAYRW
jgi:hypothetical protein